MIHTSIHQSEKEWSVLSGNVLYVKIHILSVVFSINHKRKEVSMVSMGRDLYIIMSAIIAMVVYSSPCTDRELAVFTPIEIAGPVNMCRSKTDVRFTLPPVSELNEMERVTMCKEKLCKEMIAAIDDLEIPRCDVIYMGKNITLQNSLDLFTSECDTSTPTPSKKLPEKRTMENSAAYWKSGFILGITLLVVVSW